MSQSLLKAEHIKISFGNVHALRDVSLEILPGERYTVLPERMVAENQLLSKLYPVSIREMAEQLNLTDRKSIRFPRLMRSILEFRLFIRILHFSLI